jgi:hypothetical protein
MLVSDTETTGTYMVKSCGKSVRGDHGTFEITD